LSSEDGRFLEVAATLGHRIADAAIWFEGRCNWIGAVPRESRSSPSVEALGPDLYGGTSGVALFLAEAAAKLDDDRLRATALGAIRHALEHAGEIDHRARDGLYAGLLGIAYSATRVAAVLDAEEEVSDARGLMNAWRRERTRVPASDVTSGCAGAIVGLAVLCDLIDEPWLADSAAKLGEELTARAQITTDGWSWPAPGAREMHNLCGYAHGVAGIGHAFVELFELTSDTRFSEAGCRAFDYERSWIDLRTGTWPDLRGVARRTGRDAPLVEANSWCNGATGIALSRCRAAEVINSEDTRRDARIGLDICEGYAVEMLEREPDDFSLCHGAAGSGDALLVSATTPECPRASLAAEVGRWGIEHANELGVPGLARGVLRHQTPGLLAGLAGIGMFYLRLFDPVVTSPLLIRARA
jgi:lantibiotic biosynthesis protein